MISGIGKVVVPVDDQERAKRFWTMAMGFERVPSGSSNSDHQPKYALGQWS
jgi:hypothetical protein